MRSFFYQEQWERLQESPTTNDLESLAQRVASSFVDRYYYSDEYNREYINLLCEMATYFKKSKLNQIAAQALFGIVIERLCDDFEELQTETYNRVICQVVNFLCELPEGQEIQSQLSDFDLHTEELLYERIETIRLSPDRKLQASIKPKKVLVLSRVTIGADVAITSVICKRVSKFYPEAEIIVFGNAKLKQVFGSLSGLKVHELSYSRRGVLLERFLTWLDLLKKIRAEIVGLSPAEFLLIDPDSRLTQLGVLPLVPLQNYCFFNSRGRKEYSVTASISELTNLWLDNILGEQEFCYPSVWPESSNLQNAKQLRKTIDPEGSTTLITLNFGVGGNTRKRVEGNFEAELVVALLRQPDIRLILDLGFGEEEQGRIKAIMRTAQQQGATVQALNFGEIGKIKTGSQLLGVECTIGEIAALIAVSDEFIGYDSACQHIAAAEQVKTYTVFAGTTNVRFIRRWHASGTNTSEIIYVDTISKDSNIDNTDIIGRLLDLRQS
jgi:ADP-heptose:LPS heptosyltransferase